MRNAVIGIVLTTILVITGVTLYGLETKTTRQNELDANLSSAMKGSMQIMAMNPKYSIDKENSEQIVADFIQSFLVRMNSKSEYEIDVLAVDSKKGIFSVRVTEKYQSIYAERSVSATRTVVLDEYENKENEYFKVTFYKDLEGGKLKNPVKQVNVYGGSSLVGFEPATPVKEGYSFKGWNYNGYVYNDISDVEVTDNIDFVASWEKDSD